METLHKLSTLSVHFQLTFYSDLIIQQQEVENIDLCIELINRADPIEFAFELWRNFQPKDKLSSDMQMLRKEDLIKISTALYSRYNSLMSFPEIIEKTSYYNLRSLLSIGAEIDEKLKSKIEAVVLTNCKYLLKIIKSFSKLMTSSEFKDIGFYSAGFNDVAYMKLSEVVDIDSFFNASVKCYQSDDIMSMEFEPEGEVPLSDKEIVYRFQKIHILALGD